MLVRFLKKTNKISFLNYFIYLILLLVSPDTLAELDKEMILDRESKTNQAFIDRRDDEYFVREKSSEFKEGSLSRIREIRKACWKAFVRIFFIYVSALSAALLCLKIFGLPSKNIFFLIRITSSLFILFGMYTTVGRSIHSFGGQTIPENLDTFLGKLLPTLGILGILFTYLVEHFFGL
ncbi:MAG: hypothetical protein P9L96_04265 [Candidatus Gygaella obscura]|nr:hypothetical protein [Candidatus Gygaella obscura]